MRGTSEIKVNRNRLLFLEFFLAPAHFHAYFREQLTAASSQLPPAPRYELLIQQKSHFKISTCDRVTSGQHVHRTELDNDRTNG